ncbi:P-loop containing nucleoside triphosphate hydrolase protein [Piptocephalis cylindrospora]|uniref:RNA helicase n=1 Tax=Piptocephalis cylindrospora TaxID=1907219 RepID=A0A4P9XZ48_9FUNG|nr:P-loop containing nucleoside triphosphate hydrolase protein [Piptocephalis cylindrospora]|eukprot:RKP11743.1 P-loop containing nucleoside triphosphate hydrolase protein [Piptocephalis cylindrospora]
MAILARKGSNLVRDRREQRERMKNAEKFDLAGTTLGQVMGIQGEEDGQGKEAEGVDAEEVSDSKFQTSTTNGNGEGDSEASSMFAQNLTLQEQRHFLPAYSVRDELLSVIRDHQVVVIVGETGSGKTTQLTQYLLEDGYGAHGMMIGCTQPRQSGSRLGGRDCTSAETRIKYMTDGVLLRESLRDRDLERYSCLVMDEAHERSLSTDVLLGLMRRLLGRRPTMNAARFCTFFGNCPSFTIPGRTFPVDTTAVRQSAGDILVFMTVLEERVGQLEEVPPLTLLPIYSQMPADLQARIFQRDRMGARKVIVATNIAETSLTVDGVVYVVDPGLGKMTVFNPRIGMDALQVFPISQANARQRSGRAGRTGPGTCYRLYTEGAYEEELTNLAHVILLLNFDFMDPPPQENLLHSMHQLWILGALDGDGDLTPLGQGMNAFPLDPPLAKMLLVARELGCVQEIVVPPKMEESDAARERFFVAESDHLTLLNVLKQWKAHGFSEGWCRKHYLHGKVLRRAKEVEQQLVDILRTEKIPLVRCIAQSYFHHAARQKGMGGEYVGCRTGMPCHLHPTSALFGLGYTPAYLVYHELVLTRKEYMQCVTSVDPRWLAEAGPMFYTLKEAGKQVKRLPQTHGEGGEGETREREEKERRRAKEQRALDRQGTARTVQPRELRRCPCGSDFGWRRPERLPCRALSGRRKGRREQISGPGMSSGP